MSKSNANCIVCIIQTWFDICQWLLPLKGFCQHSTFFFKSSSSYFKCYNYFIIFDYLITAFLTFPIITYLFYLPYVCQDANKSLCVILITDQNFSTSTVYASLLHINKFHIKAQEVNGWIEILKNRKLFELGEIVISSKKVKQIARERDLVLLLSYILIFIMIIVQLIFSYDNFKWSELRILLMFLCFTFQVYVSNDLILRFRIIGAILHKMLKNLNKSLVLVNEKKNKNMVYVFQRYNRLILAINSNLNLTSQTMAAFLASWILNATVSLILNIYISIQYSEYSAYVLGLLLSRTFGTIFAILGILLMGEKHLKQKSEEILSFLFKYPTSKLTLAESAQMELLITTLIVNKPVLRASDIFTVGTKLLASISGTVVTYVLVAMQFHASWDK